MVYSNAKLRIELRELNIRLAAWAFPDRVGYECCPTCGAGVRHDDEWSAIVCQIDGGSGPCPWHVFDSDPSRPYVVPNYFCDFAAACSLLDLLRHREYYWTVQAHTDCGGECAITDSKGRLVADASTWQGPDAAICMAIDRMIQKPPPNAKHPTEGG